VGASETVNPALQQTGGCLVARSGARSGTRFPLSQPSTRIGRSPESDVVIDGDEAAIVSLRHAEVVRETAGFRVRDLGSTNGTYVDGQQITDVCLTGPATIRLGMTGPEFELLFEEAAAPVELDKTVMVPRTAARLPMPKTEPLMGTFDGLLTEAVSKARKARGHAGASNETMLIMREALGRALHTSNKRSRRIIVGLAISLVVVSAAAGWKIWDLHREKTSIDRRILDIEAQLEKAGGAGAETDALIERLEQYQGEARQLQSSLFYRIANRPQEDLVTGEIRTLMNEFGAEVYSVPPEFTERVKYYLAKYQDENRPLMAHALSEGQKHLKTAREILIQEQLPEDLAWIPLVESALAPGESAAGAAGPWQFTAPTARGYGLRVDNTVDERKDLRKSTRAACKYLRELILDFGSGSSVMLALAAYNSGPAKVKHAVMKNVRDPIKQRNFWYLYRVRALPAETREYVPKVAAVMIIGRNPARFGFEAPAQ
jgi:pSer/pThr/pTyr-binding forkhead associated (FHA) protein